MAFQYSGFINYYWSMGTTNWPMYVLANVVFITNTRSNQSRRISCTIECNLSIDCKKYFIVNKVFFKTLLVKFIVFCGKVSNNYTLEKLFIVIIFMSNKKEKT